MAKTYPELLGEWVKRRDSTKRDTNLVAFLAVRDDVRQAVEAGYAIKTIWTHMHDAKRVTFGYDTFLNYVNRHIRQAAKESPASARAASSALAVEGQGPGRSEIPPRPKMKEPDAMSGFTFNAAPKKEDLL